MVALDPSPGPQKGPPLGPPGSTKFTAPKRTGAQAFHDDQIGTSAGMDLVNVNVGQTLKGRHSKSLIVWLYDLLLIV